MMQRNDSRRRCVVALFVAIAAFDVAAADKLGEVLESPREAVIVTTPDLGPATTLRDAVCRWSALSPPIF